MMQAHSLSSQLYSKTQRPPLSTPHAPSTTVRQEACDKSNGWQCHIFPQYQRKETFHDGQRLGLVELNLVVLLSARFCLGSCKVGRNGRAGGLGRETSKIRSNNTISDHHGHPVKTMLHKRFNTLEYETRLTFRLVVGGDLHDDGGVPSLLAAPLRLLPAIISDHVVRLLIRCSLSIRAYVLLTDNPRYSRNRIQNIRL